jgi:hypothetical protein
MAASRGEHEEPAPFSHLALDRVYRALNCLKCSLGFILSVSANAGLLSVTLSVALRPPVFHWYPLL